MSNEQHPQPCTDWRGVARVGALRSARASRARLLLKSRRGMSLVEVMVVIAIILTLMGIIGYGVMQVFGDSQVDMTKLTMTKISERATMYSVKSVGQRATAFFNTESAAALSFCRRNHCPA